MRAIILITTLLIYFISFSQIDTSFIGKLKALDTVNNLKADTTSVPDDALTKKIRMLRSEKNGLTIETILKIKIGEEQQKDTAHSKEFYDKLLTEITTGKTSKLIENCVLNLYRRNFTEQEVDDIVKFYKTSAGKKMSKEFLLIMVQSVKDAEQLLKLASGSIQ